MKLFVGRPTLESSVLTAAQAELESPKAAAALERLRPLADRADAWLEPDTIPERIGLFPAESQLFRLLTGEDVMLSTSVAVRVAARFADSKSNEKNILSDGKLDIARLVGAGDKAPLRMAALRLLGTTVCKPKESKCGVCPLAEWCVTARKGPLDPTIF